MIPRLILCVLCTLCTVCEAFAAEAVRVVAEDSVRNPRQPQAAVDEDGKIYVAFGAGESIYCCTSADGGKTYGEAVKIGDVPKLALGMRRGPRIAAGREAVVVSAISHDSGDLLAWRSADGGATWQGPVRVNDSPSDAREGLHAMARGPGGELFCTWLDLRNTGTQLYGAASGDGGETWSENRRVYASPDDSICECCHPAATFDSKGGLHVMWRNSLAGFRDLYAATSADGGKTFTAAAKLGRGGWKLEACPMDGGYLAATAPGKVTTVWRRDRQVYRSDTGQRGEQLLGSGEQPWIAATTDGVYIVWLKQRPGELWLSTPAAREPRKLAAAAIDPMVAAPVSGEGTVVVVWETGKKGDSTILAEVLGE